MAVQDDIRKKRDEFSAGKPIQATQVAPTRVQAGTVNATQVAPGRVLPSAPVIGSAPAGSAVPLNVQRSREEQARQTAQAGRSESFVANTAKTFAPIVRGLSDAFTSASKTIAPGYAIAGQPSAQTASVERTGAAPRQRKFGAVATPAAPAAPATATAPTRNSTRNPVSASQLRAPSLQAQQQPVADAMRNPAPNTFVSARQGVRQVGEDGSISGAPLTRGSFNVVPASAISNPGIGTLGANFAGASQAPNLYRQQVAQAQARNAATNARANEAMIAGREPGAGDFRPTLSPEQSARVLASRQLQGEQEGAAAEIASREQIAQQGEAGADRRLAQQGQQRMGEIQAQQNAPQLQLDGMGKPFVYDAATRTLSPVSGGEGFTGARPQGQRNYSQEADDRLLSSLIKAQVDPITNQPFPDAAERAQQQLAQIRGGQQQKPSIDAFKAELKKLNPNATDEELQAEYLATFGG